MMNAINFIDGLDGLLSGLTAISGMSMLVIALTQGHPEIALVLAALVGGALGFLPYNYNPAKIILGDSGALFIGYVFATVSIIGREQDGVHDLAARPAGRPRAAGARHRRRDRAPHARGKEDSTKPTAGISTTSSSSVSGSTSARRSC